MKKHKLISVFSFIIVSFLTINIAFITNVFAKDPLVEDKPKEEEKEEKKSCLIYAENNQYYLAEKRYSPYSNRNQADKNDDDDGSEFVFVPNHFPEDCWVRAEIRNGVFDVYVFEIINGTSHKEQPVQQFTLGGSSPKSRVIRYEMYDEPKDYAIVFVLKESDDLCTVGQNTLPKQNEDGSWTTNNGTGFIYYYYLGIPSKQTDKKITNVNYNGICSALRTGNYNYDNSKYTTTFEKVGLTEVDFNAYKSRVNFPYCYNQQVSYNYSKKDVAQIIKNKIDSAKIEDKFKEWEQTLTGPEDATVVNNTDLTSNPIQCPAYKDSNGSTIPNKTATTQKYYHQSEIKNEKLNLYSSTGNQIDGVCKQTCEETVTVTYGPPVATKAGLCFEYKVKVESNVKCQTEFTAQQPEPDDYKICTPVGSCNGGTYHSASGPNDEFDSCVTKCDGGEYTQKCIDKCYSKTYQIENDSTLPLNYTNRLYAQPMGYNDANINELDQNTLNYYNQIITSGPNSIGPGKQYSIEDLQIAITEAGTGFYEVQNGSIKWNSGQGRYWEIPGRYYILNIPSYTITRLQNVGRCNTSYKIPGFSQCGISLIDTELGILRNNAGTSYCGAACSWTGCSTAKTNGYYTSANKKATNRQFLNSADAIEVYKKEFETYQNAAAECKAKATCTTKTAEFTIKVNNKTTSATDVDNFISYKQSVSAIENKSGATVNGKALGTDTDIILSTDGCYTNAQDKKQTEYMTEWSFPGTWMNNKTGNISYQEIKGNAWHLKKDKFCTNINSSYVNEAWWEHRMKQPTTHFDSATQATIEEYNILATARDFGFFNWDIDVNCFYALSDICIGPKCGGTEDDPPCVGEECNDAKPLSYIARTIDLADMFPNNDNEAVTEDPNETGRNQGYNWTDGASNVKNSDYEITPGALYPVIQQRGSSIYDADKNNEYLDYEFYLTPADLNTIRRYSEYDGNNKYNSYPGKVEVVNGVAVYESALFRSSSTSSYKLDSDSIITLGALGVNNQKRKGSNEAEVFTNTYTAGLLQSRNDFLESRSGGNVSE